MVKDTAEVVAEAVEDAATVAEKVSSEVAEQLPENGRLRTAVVLLEHASKEVAEEAHLAQNIIHKVHVSSGEGNPEDSRRKRGTQQRRREAVERR